MFHAPGSTSHLPVVATSGRPCVSAASVMASAISAAPCSASRRVSIGVVPAWSVRPSTVITWLKMPVIVSTIPSCVPSSYMIRPCSMCSSKKASRSERIASRTFAGSSPTADIAWPIDSPVSSHSASSSAGSIMPSIPRVPQKVAAKRLPSSSTERHHLE